MSKNTIPTAVCLSTNCLDGFPNARVSLKDIVNETFIITGSLNSRKGIEIEKIASNKVIKRPMGWSRFPIKPIRIEFMQFKKARFHKRILYEFKKDKWISIKIQP